MTGRREKPDFIVDPSGRARDVGHMRYASSQEPPRGPPGDGPGGQSKPPSPKKPTWTTRVIWIPIGLILSLVALLVRYLLPSQSDPGTFNSESAYNSFQSGNYNYFRGEYDKAIIHCSMAIHSESDVGDVYNARGLAYHAQRKLDRALADFDRALELMPDSTMVYNNRAVSHLALGDYDQAIADLVRAIELEANNGKAYYNRGLAYYALGDYDQAFADLTQAVEYSEDWSSLWRAIPKDEAPDVGSELSAAFDNQLRAMKLRVDLASVCYQRGLAYLAKGEYDSAAADLSEAVQLQPDLSEANYALGFAVAAGEQTPALLSTPGLLSQKLADRRQRPGQNGRIPRRLAQPRHRQRQWPPILPSHTRRPPVQTAHALEFYEGTHHVCTPSHVKRRMV